MGRGTVRRSRMVEGFCAEAQQSIRNGLGIGEHVLRRYSQDLDTFTIQPRSADIVTLRAIAKIMGSAIDLDRKFRRWAIEVENISTDRVLPTKSNFSAAQPYPEQLFRQRQRTSEASRILIGFIGGAHR
jgi:hypothetical protein